MAKICQCPSSCCKGMNLITRPVHVGQKTGHQVDSRTDLCVSQAIASPREMLLNKVPFPLPTPSIFNLDQINAFAVDNLVSEDGEDLAYKLSNIFPFLALLAQVFLIHPSAALTFEDLSIMPQKLKGYPVEYLVSYRKGGPSFGSTVSEKMRSSEM